MKSLFRSLDPVEAAALADALTTLHDVELYGAGIEAHPVQRIVFNVFGPMWGVPMAKIIQIAFVLLVALWWRPWTRWVLGVCTILYALAAVNNYFLIL